MHTVIWWLCALAALASHPVLMTLDRIRGRNFRRMHLILAGVGAVILAIDAAVFFSGIGQAEPDVREWAVEFFGGYMRLTTLAILIPLAAICAGALTRHKMKRMRSALVVAVSLASMLAAIFAASTASGGQFPLDLYIRWIAPGQMLLLHLAAAAERPAK